jgi:hypothetical protein
METCDSEMSQIARSMDSSSSDMLQIAWKMYAAKNHEFEVNKTYHIFFCYPYVSPTCGRWRRRDRKYGFLIRLIWAQPKTANMFAQDSIQMYHFVVGFVATTFCALTHTHTCTLYKWICTIHTWKACFAACISMVITKTSSC